MNDGKKILKNMPIIKSMSEFVTGDADETFMVISLNKGELSIAANQNLTPEGAWGLARLAEVEICNAIRGVGKDVKK